MKHVRRLHHEPTRLRVILDVLVSGNDLLHCLAQVIVLVLHLLVPAKLKQVRNLNKTFGSTITQHAHVLRKPLLGCRVGLLITNKLKSHSGGSFQEPGSY